MGPWFCYMYDGDVFPAKMTPKRQLVSIRAQKIMSNYLAQEKHMVILIAVQVDS